MRYNFGMDKKSKNETKRRCGLCGKSGKLVKTDCCGQWICDDNSKYVMFSFARNSCWRNHNRYTLCAHHFYEKHKGDWQTCKKCLDDFDTEDYVDLGTNSCNFEKLKNPPTFEPTRCVVCNKIIVRAKEGYALVPQKGIVCEKCHWKSRN